MTALPWEWECWRDPSHEVGKSPLGWPQCKVCRAAPPYHERPNYVPDNLMLGVFVPKRRTSAMLMISARSGVVGYWVGQRVMTYYEGWANGPMQYADRDARGLWEAGIEHAAGRLITDYPTVAQGFFPGDDLIQIGFYNPKTKRLIVNDEAALNEWLETA